MKASGWFLVIVLMALLTRFIGLDHPAQVVFDEVHFGKFITAYCCNGERFFDIHPPHAKLLIAGGAYVLGYRGGFSFSHIGQPYGEVWPMALRWVTALAGSLLPGVFFLFLRSLKLPMWSAVVGGLVLAFDNALIVQSRVISLDTILLLATVGSLWCMVVAATKTGWVQGVWLAAAGGWAGLALGSKFTGLTALALLLLMWLVWQRRSLLRLSAWWAVLILILSAGVVYLTGWVLHFWLLPLPGPGDAWRVPTWHGWWLTDFWRETAALHRLMLDANYNLTATHPDQSPWWSWPLMMRPVFYWSGMRSAIYFLGNPVVWWGGFVLTVVAIVDSLRRWRQGQRQLPFLGWAVLGYVIAMGPLIGVPRALFLYHYLTALVFSWVIALIWLSYQKTLSARWSIVLAVAVIAGFVIMLPLSYALPIVTWYQDWLSALPRWG